MVASPAIAEAAIVSGHPAVDRYLAEGFGAVPGMSSRFATAICGHLVRRQTELGVKGYDYTFWFGARSADVTAIIFTLPVWAIGKTEGGVAKLRLTSPEPTAVTAAAPPLNGT